MRSNFYDMQSILLGIGAMIIIENNIHNDTFVLRKWE